MAATGLSSLSTKSEFCSLLVFIPPCTFSVYVCVYVCLCVFMHIHNVYIYMLCVWVTICFHVCTFKIVCSYVYMCAHACGDQETSGKGGLVRTSESWYPKLRLSPSITIMRINGYLNFLLHFIFLFVGCMYHGALLEVRRQLVGVDSLLFWGLNIGHLAQQEARFLTKLPCQP